MDNYEAFKHNQRREQEKTRNYPDPWIYSRERELKQKNCNCKYDPTKHKGICMTCGGWVM
jgi:hypothetical protein